MSLGNMDGNVFKEPAISPPSCSKMAEISRSLGFDLDDSELQAYRDVIADSLRTIYQRLSELPDPKLPVKYPRTPGCRPAPEDNPCNAWYWKCDIQGATSGKLHGKTIAVKDNICVAGVPMTNGTSVMEGYVPDVDATVVSRILDAGGHIVGKAVCEALSYCTVSFTSSTGPVLNPHDHSRMTGGSSSGSAALVAGGHVTMALGGDQGASIRIPAAMCGIVGLKPTYGLVPYTGICPSEYTLDHVGPMARNVQDVALLLEVLVGFDDGKDHRQTQVTREPQFFSQQLTGDISHVRVGLLKQGFGHHNSEPDVDEMVKKSAELLAREKARTLEEVSVPMHCDGGVLFDAIADQGGWKVMLDGGGYGGSCKGYHVTSLQQALSKGLKTHPNEMSATCKCAALLGRFLHDSNHDVLYSKAQNLVLELSRAYDDVLKNVDVLIMPTCPTKARPFPPQGLSIKGYFDLMGKDRANTCPFNLTGHPALSINAGFSEGLPVGMMIVGRKFEESTVLNVAFAFEKIRDAI